MVDDGSMDNTWNILKDLHEKDPRWKAFSFSRNFGHQIAVSAGLHYAKGDCIVVMDADLQDPPEEIQRFLIKRLEGYDIVYAIRQNRKENLLIKLCYKIFYRLLGKVGAIKIPLDSGDFCLMDKKVVEHLKLMPERSRFVRGLRAWVGFKQVGLTYDREGRAAGRPQYTLTRLIKLASDGIFSFSTVPLRIMTYIGLIVSTLSILGAFFSLLQRVFSGFFSKFGLAPVPGYATTVISIFFIGGIQLISLGILGEYIGRIFEEVKNRPLWIVSKSIGMDSEIP